MRALNSLLLAASLVALSACAAAPPATTLAVDLRPAVGPDGARTTGSAYGQFLAGQAALNDGRADQAADFFSRAGLQGADSAEVRQQAFTTAVLAGEITRAAALAPTGPDAPPVAERLGRLVRAVEALASDHPKDGKALLDDAPIGPPFRRAAVLVSPFIAAAVGDAEGAVSVADVRSDRIIDVFGKLGQAQMYERAKRYDEAETNYKAVAAASGVVLFPLDYGGFLERRKRYADAVAVYDAALAQAPNDADVRAARARAAARKSPPPAPTLKQGAARALVAASAGAVADRQGQLAQVYLQLALRLEPTREEAILMLGDVLADSKDPEAARAAYARISPKSSAYVSARTKLAWTYQSEGEKETAVRMAEDLVKTAPGDRVAASTLADLLRVNERYAESAAVLDTIMPKDSAKEDDWQLLYMRGVALEQAGRGADAEKDLVAALALKPDEPELLNYLGYMWIDRGERLDEAQKMIEKALATNPRSGAMIDSLAWAYYRKGDYPTAVTRLERAVELEPADPDINDHLGDAYWRVGRRIEAEFQWRRVLSLEPSDKKKAEVEAKLANGLGPNGPAARPTVAGR